MITEWIAGIGVDLAYTDRLPAGWLGAYDDDTRRILLRPGLTRPLEEQALTHEYVHAWHRDRTSHPTVEWRAWRESAQLIVEPLAYAAAERVSTSSLYIAQELGTTVKIIESFRHAMVRGEILAHAA